MAENTILNGSKPKCIICILNVKMKMEYLQFIFSSSIFSNVDSSMTFCNLYTQTISFFLQT